MDKKTGLFTIWKGFSQRAGGQKGSLLLLIGIAGMVLIFLSTLGSSSPDQSEGQMEPQDTQVYLEELEERLAGIVGQVDGVGRCEVMITAENGIEYVYAVEESENLNTSNSYDQDGARRQTQQQTSDQRYILLDVGGGNKQALLKTQRQPAIQGVVVVCQGAGSMVVQERVTEVVTTALGIPYTKVCVTKISE